MSMTLESWPKWDTFGAAIVTLAAAGPARAAGLAAAGPGRAWRLHGQAPGGGVAEALREVEEELCGISTAKLLIVVRIKFTAAITRAESVGFEMCADSSSAARFWLRSEIAL